MATEEESVRSKFVDIWSFGMLLYFIFTEKTPWPGGNNAQKQISTFSSKPNFLDQHPRTANIQIDEIIESCSNFEYKLRPTIEEVVTKLEQLRYS